MSLTKEQLQVVLTKDKNLLVSASAGSGKTYTMIERIFHLLKQEQKHIKNFLIVTFTKAAASEMKQKIVERILVQVDDNEHLKQQLDELSYADISTLHTFCAKLVKQYFYEVSIDPASKVIEEEESSVLKNESLTQVINQFTKNNDEVFYKLFETYNKKRRDIEFRKSVFQLYHFLKTKHDSTQFIKSVLQQTYTTNLQQNVAATYINNWFLELIDHYKQEFETLLLKAKQNGSESLALVVEEVNTLLLLFDKNNTFTKNLAALNNLDKLPTMPRTKEPLTEALKEEISNKKTALKKSLDEAKKWFGASEDEVTFALQSAKPLLEKLLQVVQAFDEQYQALKKERGLLDFNDLEHYTLQILNNKNIQKVVQEKYDYVFIDEYQDTNQLQEEILQKIVRENNAFMVGDVKQSIYMFRECDPQIFVKKYEAYETQPHSQKIDLNQNFRSERGVLEFANFVFSNIMKEQTASVNYQKNASFVAGASYQKSKQTLPLVGVSIIDSDQLKQEQKPALEKTYSVLEHMKQLQQEGQEFEEEVVLEAQVIANKIYEFMQAPIYDAKLKKYREVKFSDIAILSRVRGTFFKSLCREFEKYHLPISAKYKENVLNSFEAELIHNYLKLLNNPQDDIALFHVLSSHMCKITYDQLSSIRIAFLKEKMFYQAVERYVESFDNEVTKKIVQLFETLEQFRKKQTYVTLEELVRQIIEEYDLENYFCSLENAKERLANLKMILANLKREEFEYSLFQYLYYIENYADDELFEVNASSKEDSITITTIHASKGLEYPIVIVAGMGREFSRKPNTEEIITNKELGFGVRYYNLLERSRKNTVVRNACLIKNKEEELAEEMRLLYVAMTRAKNHLWMVGKINLGKVERLKSVFSIQNANSYLHWVMGSLTEEHLTALKRGSGQIEVAMLDGTLCRFEVVDAPKEQKQMEQETQINWGSANEKTKQVLQKVFSFEYAYQKNSGIATKSSVSEIMLEDEQEEGNYAIQTLRVDELTNKKEELDFSLIGSVHHTLMQHLPFSLNSIKEVKEHIVLLIKQNLLPPNALELVNLEVILTALKTVNNLAQNAKNVLKEQQFMMYVPYCEVFQNSAVTDKILVQGVIDCVIEKEDEVILIDYKTSRMSEASLQKKYATQLRLYQMAYEKAHKKKINQKLIYSFHLNHIVNV
jgi:ATP-dependent helicase/nuclease subunit A